MKKLLFLTAVLFVVGCKTTETPPQWWNPSGKYAGGAISPESTTQKKTTTTGKNASAPAEGAAIAEPAPTYENTFTPVKIESVEVISLEAPSVLED